MTFYLIIITIIIGAVLQINLIGSRAFLVSNLDPIVAVYTGIIAGLMSTFFFRVFATPKMKFAYFAFGLCVLQSIIYASLFMLDMTPNTLAVVWITLAAFSIGICKWITVEMANKYLDPARAQSFFSYLSSFLGVGFIISFIIFKVLNISLTPKETLLASSCLFFATSLFIMIGFFPKRILEINFEKHLKQEVTINFSQNFLLQKWFSLLCIVIGGINITFTYLINVQIKHHLTSFEMMNEVINNYTLTSSLLIVIAGVALGQVIKRKRSSPIMVIFIANLVLLILTFVCIIFRKFEIFIALEVAQKFIGQALIAPSMQQIINSFINSHKKIFISIQHFFYFTFTSPLLAGVFYYSSKLSFNNETIVICLTIITLIIFGYFVLRNFEKLYRNLLVEYIKSNIFVAKVLATQMLSFLRPRNFVQLMKSELNKNQKNYLRKTIIVGLGYSPDGSTTDIIKNEFMNDKEEVQIAVLEALSTQERFEGVSFLMDILSMKVLPKSFQVRLNATKLIAKLYDVKAIPIILEGLHDSDHRVVANVLETLSLFKNKDLIKYFIKFSQHETSRVRANALMGCYKYKKTRVIYDEVVRESISKNQEKLLPSLFYIIGVLKDKTFIHKLNDIAMDISNIPNSYIAPLAYALICNNQKSGYKLAICCFMEQHQANKEISFTHFFSQLTKVQRFDFIRSSFANRKTAQMINTHLKKSRFDFHEEVNYLNILIEAGTS
jgi:hypothetical protein